MSWLSSFVNHNKQTLTKVATVIAPVATISTAGAKASPASLAGGPTGIFSSFASGASSIFSNFFSSKAANKSAPDAPEQAGVVTSPTTPGTFLGSSKLSPLTLVIIGVIAIAAYFLYRKIR